MFEEMLGSFLSSTQGQGAAQALTARGLGAGQTQQILAAALPAAAASLGKQASAKSPTEPALGMFDLLGGHPGQAFLIGAATSMMRGEGVVDAMQDGAASVVGAHIGEVIGSRLGLDRQTSAQVSAAITPFIVSFVQEKISGRPEVIAKHGTVQNPINADRMAAKPGAAAAKAIGGKPMGAVQGKPMGAVQGKPVQGKPMGAVQGKPMAAAPGKPIAGKPIPGKPMKPKA